MKTHVLSFALLTSFLCSPFAWADDDLLADDGDEWGDEQRLDGDDSVDLGDDEAALDAIDETIDGDGDDLLGEGASEPTGADSAETYRAQINAVKGLSPDEEMIAWEAYLERYPDSSFAARIEKRVDGLMSGLYETQPDGVEEREANAAEFKFTQGMLIENINPRSHLLVTFDYLFPNHVGFNVDYEKALQRNLSVHGGVRTRNTGLNIEGGVKYALIKSLRTQSLLTGLMDVHVGADPAFLGLRPMVAGAKRFQIGGAPLDVQLQVGTDLDLRKASGFILVGGANITYRPDEKVALFLETSLNQKWAGKYAFRSNLVVLGLRVFPGEKKDKLEVTGAVQAPFSPQYTANSLPGLSVQGNLWLDE